MRSTPVLRAAALVLTAALALHELRYLIAGRPAQEAFGSGHGYLPLVGVGASLLLGVAVAKLVSTLAHARRTGRADERTTTLARTWMLATGALLALHFGQELLEAAVTGRGAVSLDGGSASLVALLAALLGGLVALGLRGACRAVVAAAHTARA
ncbi:MAG: hypothetical protein M3350_08240, partial [Actinomycetota bacterium]|nr:hypothetical protein [Actinomycetota bacterium]